MPLGKIIQAWAWNVISDLVWMVYFLIMVLVLSIANTLFIGGLLYLILNIQPKFHQLISNFRKKKK